ncbi:MAG TPA: PAC2 family protein [Methanocorpusculum sp.]|nr:PAC2 family protein [Methanocorpusculum sp.]
MEISSSGFSAGTHADVDAIVRISAEIPSSKESILIAGFPGSGLVGSIAVQYLVDKLAFTQIGNIVSPLLPSASLAADGLAQAPLRLYEKDNLLVFLSDVPVPEGGSYIIPAKILAWLLARTTITEIVVIGGVITGGTGERVFGAATTKEGIEKIKKSCLILPALNITGITGGFLTEACMWKVPAIGFLVETNYDVDSRAAAAGLDVISSLYKFKIDTMPLITQADTIEPMLQKLADDVKNSNVQPPTSFGHDMMYG